MECKRLGRVTEEGGWGMKGKGTAADTYERGRGG